MPPQWVLIGKKWRKRYETQSRTIPASCHFRARVLPGYLRTGYTHRIGCATSAGRRALAHPYDQGTNGVGRRVRMDDGSGYTTWSYDSRGRVTEAYQSVTGSGIFRTQWSYNAADLPVWMKYPADNAGSLGETVNFTYNNQMLVDRVYGTDTYVDDTWYDPAGRATLRELGASYTLGQSYAYYPWTQQGGRLQSLQSGIAADTDSLQSLSYSYDAGGNVLTINDYHATTNPSDPQVQLFNYDALNRLANAQVINGETNGRYPQQSYDYNPDTGNMVTNAGMYYAYTYPNAPAGVAPVHGVRQVTGGIVYNGTVTVRAKGTYGCTGWPVMKLYINGTLRQQWTVDRTRYTNYTVTTGLTTDAQVDVVFTNACTGRTLQVDYVTLPTATGSRTVQAESGGTAFDRGTETGAPGENAFDGVNVLNGAELMSETGSLRFVVGLNALASGYDANGNMTLRLKDGARYFLAYDAENRLKTVSGTVSASFVYNGDGQRVAATIGTTTAYIGGYFEWKDGSGTSYYFAGAQRVAMRTITGVKYLLGDHLGSTAVTAYANGAFDTETRYYPWGGVRWSYGAPPTDYQFTGQQNVASIGLYFYNARFYDAQLGRFVSPDTIIPQQQGSQAWDRYAYVNNSPVRFTDPSGHWYYDPGCDCLVDNGEPERQFEENLYYNRNYYGTDWARSFLPHQEELPLQANSENKNNTGQLIAGAVLIVVTDLFVGLPAALVIVATGGVTPPAVAAEALELLVVLPINILGIYLIADALEP
jgi:RHS repeat-associated protein